LGFDLNDLVVAIDCEIDWGSAFKRRIDGDLIDHVGGVEFDDVARIRVMDLDA
jgi:hypothetical protein